MAKFHIGRSGRPSQCSAKEGNCPFASESEHYNSKKEAEQAIYNKLNKEINTLQPTKKTTARNNVNNFNILLTEEGVNSVKRFNVLYSAIFTDKNDDWAYAISDEYFPEIISDISRGDYENANKTMDSLETRLYNFIDLIDNEESLEILSGDNKTTYSSEKAIESMNKTIKTVKEDISRVDSIKNKEWKKIAEEELKTYIKITYSLILNEKERNADNIKPKKKNILEIRQKAFRNIIDTIESKSKKGITP